MNTPPQTPSGLLEPDIHDIRTTIKELKSRRLIAASAWLGELLLSVPASRRKGNSKITTDRDCDEDAILAARASMDAHEYERAAHFLRNAQSERAWFLSVYSQYLASERAAIQQFHTMDGTRQQPPAPINKCIPELYSLVQGTEDEWLMFLESLFLFKLGRKVDAITVVLKSLNTIPWNWSAWCLLCDCIDTEAEYIELLQRLPITKHHPAVWMFQIKILNDLYLPSHKLCDTMLVKFEASPWLLTQKAKSLYAFGALRDAQTLYESVVATYPSRMDGIDIFSSILFLNNDLSKLSHYATRYKVFTHSPEACIFIGNTYSLRIEHEKASKYYLRATRLHPYFSLAYTLLGHAYLDMGNTHAAIQAYRRTLYITKKDFRAWFGLGQCYRVLGMHSYALYYYQRGHGLRPGDLAIWEGIGVVYDEMGRHTDAINAFQTAIDSSQKHSLPTVHYKLAKLLKSIDPPNLEESLKQYERVIDVCFVEIGASITEHHLNSLIDAAELYMRTGKGLERAAEYLSRAATCPHFDEGARIKTLQTQLQALARRSNSTT